MCTNVVHEHCVAWCPNDNFCPAGLGPALSVHWLACLELAFILVLHVWPKGTLGGAFWFSPSALRSWRWSAPCVLDFWAFSLCRWFTFRQPFLYSLCAGLVSVEKNNGRAVTVGTCQVRICADGYEWNLLSGQRKATCKNVPRADVIYYLLMFHIFNLIKIICIYLIF